MKKITFDEDQVFERVADTPREQKPRFDWAGPLAATRFEEPKVRINDGAGDRDLDTEVDEGGRDEEAEGVECLAEDADVSFGRLGAADAVVLSLKARAGEGAVQYPPEQDRWNCDIAGELHIPVGEGARVA